MTIALKGRCFSPSDFGLPAPFAIETLDIPVKPHIAAPSVERRFEGALCTNSRARCCEINLANLYFVYTPPETTVVSILPDTIIFNSVQDFYLSNFLTSLNTLFWGK